MRKTYNFNPYNNGNIRNGELNYSQHSNAMPSFLIGSSNMNETSMSNSRINPQPTIQHVTQVDNKQRNIVNLRRAQSIHGGNSSRVNVPPISNTWSKSPRSSFLKTRPSTEVESLSARSPSLFNQSSVKLNQSFNESFNLNQSNSIKDTDSYNKFVQLKTDFNEDSFQNWVTVFGYGPNQAQNILGYFAEIGPILNKIISNNGNWMHLQYESKMHAVSALNKNGRIINSMAMIGVKLCDDKTSEIPNVVNLSEMYPSDCNMTNNLAIEESREKVIVDDMQTEKRFNMSFNNGRMRSLASRDAFDTDKVSAPKKGMLTRALSVLWR